MFLWFILTFGDIFCNRGFTVTAYIFFIHDLYENEFSSSSTDNEPKYILEMQTIKEEIGSLKSLLQVRVHYRMASSISAHVTTG